MMRPAPRAILLGLGSMLMVAAFSRLIPWILKLAVDDLPNGRAMTMFLSFIVFGGALIVAPRLVPDIDEKADDRRVA